GEVGGLGVVDVGDSVGDGHDLGPVPAHPERGDRGRDRLGRHVDAARQRRGGQRVEHPDRPRHRAEVVAVADGITYVDDSKATNPHAAEASVLAYPRVVWIAGGLLKGASVDAEVSRMASRLVAAVLIGRDRQLVAEALSRHAPDVPVLHVVTGEDADMDATAVVFGADVTEVKQFGDKQHSGDNVGTAVMNAAVAAARTVAKPGDTVLLAPAGASFDQFAGYADRGDAFAAAVHAALR
ncbi:glutamate ligase domain-containing protein, partial [Mycobacterium sp. 1245499.0]|uniref:glutamate ligase domain-containing protein n=1 Tax=Mycobacterium sp. 1245499.0 TaxID=1834074 RepID=UPI00350FC58B